MSNETQEIQLAPTGLSLKEQVSLHYDAVIPTGVTPEQLLKPAFWAHHGIRLRPWDEIRARAEDGTWMGTYLVLDCSRTWARVLQLSFHRLTSGDVAITQASMDEMKAVIAAHQVVHRGPLAWSVVRKSDRAVLLEGRTTKPEAVSWLEAYARNAVGGAIEQTPGTGQPAVTA